jgi:hypothetical protein
MERMGSCHCKIVLLALDLDSHSFYPAVAFSDAMLVVIGVHFLRYGYFRNFSSEVQKQRAAQRSRN